MDKQVHFTLTGSAGDGRKAQVRILQLAQTLEAQGHSRTHALELATIQDLSRTLEQATTAFSGVYSQAQADSIVEGVHSVVQAGDGLGKIGDLYPVGAMRKFDGMAKLNGWQAASYEVRTELWEWTGKIDHNAMAKLDSVFDQGFQKSLRAAADLPVATMDQEFMALLEANSAPHLGATSAFFSATNPIPGANRTFSNRVTNAITTVAEVRTAVRKMQAALIKQLNSLGIKVNRDWVKQNAVLIAHPDKLELVEDAFEPGNMGGPNVVLNDKSAMPKWDIRYNPYSMTSSKLWLLLKGRWSPLVLVVQEQPNMISTLGTAGHVTKILTNAELVQVRTAFKAAYGSPFSAVECASG